MPQCTATAGEGTITMEDVIMYKHNLTAGIYTYQGRCHHVKPQLEHTHLPRMMPSSTTTVEIDTLTKEDVTMHVQ